MAIIKTSPPPLMTVGDYRNAALQHFNTCKVLWRYIKLPDTSNLRRLPEEEVLKNIFYLTGYTAECAIKYRYLTDCYSLSDTHSVSHWVSAGAKVKKHFTFAPTAINDKNWSEQVVQALCSSIAARPIPAYLQILGNVISVTPNSSVEEDMQASWEPAIRYNYSENGLPVPPNKTDIESFYQATLSLLHSLSII